ncbi:ABC transporter substrate-binding protein [Trueperella bialowiezensis]|uniref:ABC-type taurine transport system, periplasmic component n=1 Tax=Trueperella bialowiezensis TaxID=312285 RepID=A0A3S4VRZ4_9ACTO|nr:ABC transporter substrate-binding protein [Trueperella bialowiezensis]VEI12436.1 ABC-type taurine transport system, periplasmic component [Trueperella bialowiezensis]
MKKIIAMLAAFALALGLTACSGTDSPDAHGTQESTPHITLGLTYIPDVQFAPIYMAKERGYFDEAGVDVTIRHHGPQESLFGAIQAGEEDVVFAGGDEMLQARSTGVDIVNWATMYQTYPVTLIVKADSGMTSAADLAGKKVGLPGPYGENYYGLLAMLKDHALSDVDVQYIGYMQVTALATDAVDAIIGFTNNDAVAMRNAGIDVVELPLVQGDLPLIGVGLGSLANNLDPDTLAKVLVAIEKGAQAAAEDREATLDVVEQYVPSLSDPNQRELAGKVLEATLKLYNGGETFGGQDEARWEAMAEFMAQADLLESDVKATDAYTTAVLDTRTKTER